MMVLVMMMLVMMVLVMMVFAYLLQVNEIAWNRENDQFFLTNGNGCVVILR